jgi:glutathione synthase/RimK-type ligase-like ATP-grasp enzyme
MRILAISSKETYAARRLLAEALVSNCNFVVMPIGELASRQFEVDPEEFDVLYVRNPYQDRSGKYLSGVVDLAKKFKNAGKKVVDAVIANGMLGGGKWDDYEALLSNGLPIPKTEMYNEQSQILKQERFILKWIYGFKGKNVYLAKNGDRILSQHPYSELMLQEYVDWIYRSFRDGQIVLEDYEHAVDVASNLNLMFQAELKVDKRMVYKDKFIYAISALIRQGNFDLEKFLKRVALQPNLVFYCETSNDYLQMLKNILNG